MSKVVLGKGLGALIPGDNKAREESAKYKSIPIDQIAPNPMQPRHRFDEESLKELSSSIKNDGLMQPLVVKKNGTGFTIVAGERRYRACKMAGLTEVPVMMMEEIEDSRMLELALIENIQRENLNPMETAEAYSKLMEKCEYTQQQLADKVGKSRAAVANSVRLNNLPNRIKELVRSEKLSEGHARTILSLESEGEMLEMADKIVNNSMSVRQLENETVKKKKRRLIPKRKIPTLVEMENELKRIMGTSVRINHGLKRGKVEIEYYNDDDLERLMELFRKIQQY